MLKQGHPFLPVNLRVNSDPLSILNKILEQNDRSYTQINEFVRMAREMAEAGLTIPIPEGYPVTSDLKLKVAEKRVVSMCIDIALSEDDFETAYSYVVTRLKAIGRQAHTRRPELEQKSTGCIGQRPPKPIDDWSWRAALQAGKYRKNSHTTRATHLGNTSGNLEIRHLQQRKDCLAQALRLAPRDTLQEILNAYRRCEEELNTQIKQEAEQEEAFDAKADDKNSNMPGGFAATPAKSSNGRSTTTRKNKNEEAPVSFFDLSKESITRAQTGLSALSMFRGQTKREPSNDNHNVATQAEAPALATDLARSSSVRSSMRKRDQLRNAAVGTLAGGIGWLINAPPINTNTSAPSSEHGTAHSRNGSGSTTNSREVPEVPHVPQVQEEKKDKDDEEIIWDDEDAW